MTGFCESVNGMLLCMKNRVWKCNSEGVASLMSRNERIRKPSSANSRLPTWPHCEFNGDWSCRCTALQCLAMPCILLHRLYLMTRLKWEESRANAADRDDRVQSVRNRVYSITYRCSISVQFVGVHLLLLRVNRACKACTASIAVAVGSNLDKPLEVVVVELSGLPVVHCSSLTGLLESWSVACSSIVGLAVALSLVHRWSIAGLSAGPSLVFQLVHLLVHRASVCSSGSSSVPRASCVRLLDSSLLHRWSIAGLSAGPSLVHLLVHRASLCSSVTRASRVPLAVALSLVHR